MTLRVCMYVRLMWHKTRFCHVPMAFQHVHGGSNERSENGDGENGSEIFRVGERIIRSY